MASASELLGRGLANCGPAIGLGVDMTDRASVATLFEDVALSYGGIDNVIVTAGIFVPPSKSGEVTEDEWRLTFEINVRGLHVVAKEAYKVWKSQGTPGSLVLTTSANGVVAKKGSIAYDTF